ncbi:MAG: hypothetical protein V4484_09940 [Pseudomonadota bacterium]
MTAQWWRKLNTPAAWYVVVSLLVSFVGFVRAFLFMHSLGLVELGILVFVQTIAQAVVLMQGGLINGGYRIYAGNRDQEQQQINNLLFSCFAILSGTVLLAWTICAVSGVVFQMSFALLLGALILGLATLLANWLTNTLLGSQRIAEINRINLWSVLVSVALLPLAYLGGLWGATLALAAQPIVFVSVCLLRHRPLRPQRWELQLPLIRRVLSFGFIPFLASIFVLLNYQIERWAIAGLLGAADLGRFYLVFLYATLFVLVPGSIMSIFYPKALRAHQDAQGTLFKAIVRRHALLILAYAALVAGVTLLALRPMVALLFPEHEPNVRYVMLFLPGLVALVLCDPLTLVLNVALRLRVLLWAGLSSVVLLSALIAAATMLGLFDLRAMAVIKSLVAASTFTIYATYVLRHRKELMRPPQGALI